MPDFAGLIKYPLPADKYNTAYGEPQWWRDLASTTRAEIIQQVEAGKFAKPTMLPGDDLNNAVKPGQYPYWGGTLNAPGGSGVALVSELLTTSNAVAQIVQIGFTAGGAPEINMRFSGTGGWSGWTRVDAGAVVPSAGGGGGGSGAALKRVPLILTAATGSGEDSTGAGAIRFPLHYGAEVTRWRMHIRNHNYASGISFGSGGTVSGLWFGRGWDGAFTGAPTQVSGPLTIPTDGSEVVTPWISTPIEADVRQMVSVGWTSPTSSPKVLTPGGAWRSSSSGSAPGQSGSGYAVAWWIPFDWWIEAETSPTTPTVAGYGDSITAGTGTTLPVNDSWLSQYARSIGALPVHYAYPGSGMSLWMSPADAKWTRWADFPLADAVIHFMGQNDLGTAASAAVMRDRFETTMPMIKAHISPNVSVATITPHAGKTSAQNAIRRQHATYLRTLPLGVRDLFDFAAAVSSDDTSLRPEFKGGTGGTDELHPNTAGAAAMAAAVTRPIVATPVAEAVAAYQSVRGA